MYDLFKINEELKSMLFTQMQVHGLIVAIL